eukprot:scaffold215038_cov40-Attheya_sp.AAC.2
MSAASSDLSSTLPSAIPSHHCAVPSLSHVDYVSPPSVWIVQPSPPVPPIAMAVHGRRAVLKRKLDAHGVLDRSAVPIFSAAICYFNLGYGNPDSQGSVEDMPT